MSIDNQLYPIKFTPILKSKIWGGNKLQSLLNKNVGNLNNVGESWELSGLPNELSVVSNGLHAGKNIEQLIMLLKHDLVGEKVYKKFGNHFPLLFKFIDANDYLSIQVHPDDAMAQRIHQSFGKTEMWYVIDAKKDASLIVGFNKPMDDKTYLQKLQNGNLKEVLNFESVRKGDVFFIPAGRVHATGPGILFAEIQQSSNLTYRVYDWDRTDKEGNSRELHTKLALEALNFDFVDNYKTECLIKSNHSSEIADCPYFTTNVLELNKALEQKYEQLDSFVVYMALEGDTKIYYSTEKGPVVLKKGETVLVPNAIKKVLLNPVKTTSKLLEVFIKNN